MLSMFVRFCSMVKEMISDGTGNSVELEGEGDGDTLEVSLHFSRNIINQSSISRTSRLCLCASVRV